MKNLSSAQLINSSTYLKKNLATSRMKAFDVCNIKKNYFRKQLKSTNFTENNSSNSDYRLKYKGFTLIEILIALSIFSIMAAMTSTVLYTVFNARDKTTQHAIRLSELQIAFVLIERDLSQIVNHPIRTSTTQETSVLGLNNEIKFSRGGAMNPLFKKKQSSIIRVHYYLKKNKLYRSYETAVDRAKQAIPHTEVLFLNVSKLQFEYIDANGQVLQQWYNKQLPKAIRISLESNFWGPLSQIYALSQSRKYYYAKT